MNYKFGIMNWVELFAVESILTLNSAFVDGCLVFKRVAGSWLDPGKSQILHR